MNAQAHLLERLQQHQIIDASQGARLAGLAPEAPWLDGLQALAAWLAALLLGVGMALLSDVSPTSLIVLGALLIVAAWALFRASHESVFRLQLALALSLAGQGLLAWRLVPGGCLLSALVALGLSVPRTSPLHRVLCLVLAVGASLLWLNLAPANWGVMASALIAGAIALCLARCRWVTWRHASYLAALTHSTILAGVALLALFHLDLSGSLDAARWLDIPSLTIGLADGAAYRLHQLSAAVIWLLCMLYLTRALPARIRAGLLGAALLLALSAHLAPALLLCLALALASFYACQRAWFTLALMAAGGFLGLFYYNLAQTLLLKSLVLIASGALLLGVYAGLWRGRRRVPQAQESLA